MVRLFFPRGRHKAWRSARLLAAQNFWSPYSERQARFGDIEPNFGDTDDIVAAYEPIDPGTMAQPVQKRRKVEHTPSSSDNDEDDASFVSFGDEDEEQEDDGEDSQDGGDSSEGEQNLRSVNGKESGKASGARAESAKPGKAQRGREKATTLSATDHMALSSGNFKSNLFKLQVDELLGQIRPRASGKLESAAETALHSLKRSLEQLSPTEPLGIDKAERALLQQKVAIPFPNPRPPKDAKYKLAFAKPASINVVGSFALKTSPRTAASGVSVDMIVTMPGSLFEEKDFLNHRYFYKRAYYLASLAAGIKAAHPQEFRLRFQHAHDDPLKPVLVVSPPDGSGPEKAPAPKWRINIIPCIADEQFAVEKLWPDRNCVRTITSGEAAKDSSLAPTPFYNSSLRADMLMTASLKLVHGAKKRCEAFADTCLLGGTWLRQRGFASSIDAGGFGNFEWSALVALCLESGGPGGKPLLSPGYSYYQLFKATLQLLAVKDFSAQPLVIGGTDATSPPPVLSRHAPVVWDAERGHNLLYKVQPSSYRLLRHEVRTSLNALADTAHDGFDATFIQKVSEPLLRFDSLVEIPAASLFTSANHDTVDELEVLAEVNDVLTEGLGDRIHQLSITKPPRDSWTLGASPPKAATKGAVTIGLIINPANAKRTVDHGPAAEKKAEAAAFRDFWGEKAELRRFRDGSIRESLVWQHEQGSSIIEQIVRYVLARHVGAAAAADATFFGSGWEKLLPGGSDLAAFAPFMDGFSRLSSDLRGLEDLPLSIRAMTPADPQLRYAAHPAPGKAASRRMPADVVLQFEGSARWPDDLAAIQRTKIAFLLHVKSMLDQSGGSATCRIGLENEGQDILNQGFLEVAYDAAVAFRLRVHHDREQTLLERRLANKSLDPQGKELAALGLAMYKRDYLKNPAHTQSISRLCVLHNALSGAIRLTKRWFAGHLLSNHFDDTLIELFVARTFTQPGPWPTPSSASTGFLRTLAWLARWDWRHDPVILDLSGGGRSSALTAAARTAITTRFEAFRKLDPALNRLALFVATDTDHDGNTWTDGRPAPVIAARMTALAQAACAELTSRQLSLDPAALFASPLTDFDFVLHLDRRVSKSASAAAAKLGADAAFKNLQLAVLDDADARGYDPITAFLADLETSFGAAVVFFHGGAAGDRPVIAGLWRPQASAPRAWKVNLAYSTRPVADETQQGDEATPQAELNANAMIAEMAKLGGELIAKVEVYNH